VAVTGCLTNGTVASDSRVDARRMRLRQLTSLSAFPSVPIELLPGNPIVAHEDTLAGGNMASPSSPLNPCCTVTAAPFRGDSVRDGSVAEV